MKIVRLSGFLIAINPYIRSLWELEIKIFFMFKGHVLEEND